MSEKLTKIQKDELSEHLKASSPNSGYALTGLKKLDMLLIYNCLKLYHGDFPDSYSGTELWQKEIEKLMQKFPYEIRF